MTYELRNSHIDQEILARLDSIQLAPSAELNAEISSRGSAPISEPQTALQLLRRHFYVYERYQAVRSKEMMEARVDAMFDSIRFDRDFIALTHGADGKLPSVRTNSRK